MMPGSPTSAGVLRSTARRRLVDRCFVAVCIASASISIMVLAVLLISIGRQGWERLSWDFLTSFPSGDAAEAGFKAALWGSVTLCVICALIALPLGVGAAVFLEEYRPREGWKSKAHVFIQLNISNLAGVPSIVYGLIGLTVFVRLFGLLGNPNQYDRAVMLTTDQGEVVQGMIGGEQPGVFVLDVTEVRGAALVDGAEWPERLELDETLVRVDPDALKKLGSSAVGSTIELPVMHDYRLPFDLAMSLEPPVGDAASTPITVVALLREHRPGRVSIDHPITGARELDPRRIVSRAISTVRVHELSFPDGARLSGNKLMFSGEQVELRQGQTVVRTFKPGEPSEYRMKGPIEIGDENSLLYFRLPLGGSVLAGGLTLMLVILPIVIISSQEALRAVPDSLREGAFAAGATRWQVVSKMVLPAAMPGVMTGAILAMSRAIGEAAPLLLVGGFLFIAFTPSNLMSDFAAMPLQIYQWAQRPQEEFAYAAAAGIIVLLAVLLSFNAAAILIRQKFSKPLQ